MGNWYSCAMGSDKCECSGDKDCKDNKYCNTTTKKCTAPCTADGDCVKDKEYCDTTTKKCVASCAIDKDCVKDKKYCNTTSKKCMPNCAADSDCVKDKEYCDTTAKKCAIKRQEPAQKFGTAVDQWSGQPFTFQCDQTSDDYVTEVYGKSGPYMSTLGVKCKSGKVHAPKTGQGTEYTKSCTSGFAKVTGGAASGVDGLHFFCNDTPLGKVGGGGGSAFTYACPAGQKVSRIDGVSNDNFLGSIGFSCS